MLKACSSPAVNNVLKKRNCCVQVDGNRVLVGKGETDNLGRAVVKLGNDDSQLDAVVEFKGKFTFLPRISLIEAASSRVLTALVLDRKLVVPEQTLNIKGGAIPLEQVTGSMSLLGSKISSLFEGC